MGGLSEDCAQQGEAVMDWNTWGEIFAIIVIFYYIDRLRGEVKELKQRIDNLEKR
jgi:hypothetical protein